MCFLGDGGDLAGMCDFVDFGKEAEMFLLRCGSRHEPSISDLAFLFTQQPARMLNKLGIDKYLEVLIKFAHQWNSLKKDRALVEKMQQAPFLLATKMQTGHEEEDEKGGSKAWHLAKASNIVIVDEIGNYNLFKTDVLAAPQQDETLEEMYAQ